MNQRRFRSVFILTAALIGGFAAYRFLPVRPVDVEIQEVWMHREAYIGRPVRVSGTLRRFLKGLPKDHYAVESHDGFRIGVESPDLEAMEGRSVTAVGKTVFDETLGLRLSPASVAIR